MEEISYEKAAARLSEIITLLDEGKVSMSEAATLFEEGNKLIKTCYSQLDGVKGKFTEIKETLDNLEEI